MVTKVNTGVTVLMVGIVRPHMGTEVSRMAVMHMVSHMAVMHMEVHPIDMAVTVRLTDMEAHRDMEVLNDMVVIVHLTDMKVHATGTSSKCTTRSQKRRRAWAWELWHLLAVGDYLVGSC